MNMNGIGRGSSSEGTAQPHNGLEIWISGETLKNSIREGTSIDVSVQIKDDSHSASSFLKNIGKGLKDLRGLLTGS